MCKGDKELLPVTLEAISAYLEQRESGILHYAGLNQLRNKFKNKLTSAEQTETLKNMNASQDELDGCSNQNQRAELFRKLTKEKYERTK